MKSILLFLLVIFVTASCSLASESSNIQTDVKANQLIWEQGVDTEVFWEAYVNSKGGLSWAPSESYPDYDKVKEGDTFMIELKQGPCLMEFFHSRWRRANDVRRWDDSVNAYGGCPYVFD